MTRQVFVPEAIEGWRVWRLSASRDGPRLRPNGRGELWPVRSAAVATCWRRRRHEAPVARCTCGLYAARDPSMLRQARSPAVIGMVSLWGRVVEHANGWRAGRAYPQRLDLLCHVCAANCISGSTAEYVARYRDRSMVPFCASHLELSLLIGRLPLEVIAAEDVLRAVTDAYAVERLARIST